MVTDYARQDDGGMFMALPRSTDYSFTLALWHTFGDHAGEPAANILARKGGEIARNGWTLWSFRKMKMLDEWVRHLVSVEQPRVLVFCSARGGSDPLRLGGKKSREKKKYDCQNYRLIGERTWQPVPGGVRVPHTFYVDDKEKVASAFVVRRIVYPVAGFRGSSISIEWLRSDGRWDSGPDPCEHGLPTKGEFLIRPGGKGKMREVGAILELKSPYLAEVRPDPAQPADRADAIGQHDIQFKSELSKLSPGFRRGPIGGTTMDSQSLDVRCRSKLIEVAKHRGTITYAELAAHLGIANQGPWGMLDDIYGEEIVAGHPDLTLVVVYSQTGLGRYNSEGAHVRSVKVDPGDSNQVKAYREALARVYEYWARQ
jgi:hypothetical protein